MRHRAARSTRQHIQAASLSLSLPLSKIKPSRDELNVIREEKREVEAELRDAAVAPLGHDSLASSSSSSLPAVLAISLRLQRHQEAGLLVLLVHPP